MGIKSTPDLSTFAGRIIIDEASEQLQVYDANNLIRILIGLLPDGSYGIVISVPGVDVRSLFS